MSAASLRVLVVEDDFPIRRLLQERLAAAEVDAHAVATLAEARSALSARGVDLVLLDLGLPDGDGVDFVRELRRWSTLPVLILSARHLERDKIAALDAGADDYLAKPFPVGELLARMRALTRRARGESAPASAQFGELQIDFAARRVLRAGESVHLTPIEFDVLSLLAAQAGKVVTYRQLLAAAWGAEASGQHHYVRIVVGHLRRKLEADPLRPRHLLTETGVGYRFQS
jgi:two-component system, OmpR family, KDP operon response regulator KdpE